MGITRQTDSSIEALNMLLPGTELVAITTHDTNDLARPVRGLFVGVGGDVKINDWKGNAIVLKNVASGTLLSIGATRVFLTLTTATNIIGVY